MSNNCATKGFITGDKVRVQVETTLCQDTVPTAEQWVTLGTLTSKGRVVTRNMITSEGDDTATGFQSSQGAQKTLTFSFSGDLRDESTNADAIYAIERQEINNVEGTTMWVRMFDINTTVRAFCIVSSISTDASTNAFGTFSIEFAVFDGDSVEALETPAP